MYKCVNVHKCINVSFMMYKRIKEYKCVQCLNVKCI